MNAVDINRLAQSSRQSQCGLARDHCLGQLFGMQGEMHSLQIGVLGHLFKFGTFVFFLVGRFPHFS